MDLAHFTGDTGVEQDSLGYSGLSGINVRGDTNITKFV